MQGLKRKRRCQLECFDHIFDIKTMKSNASKYDINLSFCPKFQREPLPPEHTFPQYNNDAKYYTSAFILGVDRRILAKNQQQELMDHQKQIRDSLEKHNQLIFPRPNSKHSLCSVCKETYKNYYGHISSENHRQKISLSLYNNHIKQLCRRYFEMWEGAQERADQEALKKEEQEQEWRQQMAEIQQEPFNQNFDEQEYFEEEQPKKVSKKSTTEGRTYRSEYMRKKLLLDSTFFNPEHFQREKRLNKYERERLKMDKEGAEVVKEYTKVPEKQGDVFIIMKASNGASTPVLHVQPQQEHGQFIWKRNTQKIKRESEKAIVLQSLEMDEQCQKEEESHSKYMVGNKIYQTQYYVQERNVEKHEHLDNDKFERKNQTKHPFPYYSYPLPPNNHYTHHNMPPDYKNTPENQKNPSQNSKSSIHPHQPYYPYPYYMPPYDNQYKKNEKGYDHHPPQEKQKGKNGQKPYGYPYPWQLSPSPYFMPPPPPQLPANHPSHQNAPHNEGPNNAPPVKGNYGGSTSININFPMYMYPPPPHPSGNMPYSMPNSRYPHMPPNMNMPYVNYQYPYMNQPASNRQGQFAGQNNSSNASHSNPPHHTSNHYPSHHSKHSYSYPNSTNYSHNNYNTHHPPQTQPPLNTTNPNSPYPHSYPPPYNSSFYQQGPSKDYPNPPGNAK